MDNKELENKPFFNFSAVCWGSKCSQQVSCYFYSFSIIKIVDLKKKGW